MIQPANGPERTKIPLDWWLLLLALAVALVAFAARVNLIFDEPPSLTGDEAANLTDISHILQGRGFPLYFEANNGREPLFIYMQVPLVALLGQPPYALRLTSALVGIVTVVLTYRLAKDLFGQWAHPAAGWVPLVVAFLLASSFWHVTLSRIGLRAIALPMLAVATFILFWRGYSRGKRSYYLASGAFLGLSLYTYIASRLLPLVLVLFFLGVIFWKRGFPKASWSGVALMGAGLAVVATPLALYAIGHPLLFWGRVASVSTLDTSAPSTWESVARTLEMFIWRGNYEDTTFDPGARPVFDWPMGLVFLAGLGLALASLWAHRRGRSAPDWLAPLRPEVCLFSLLWLSVMIVPSFFSYPAPHFLRTAGAAPAVYIFPALAIGVAVSRLSGVSSRLWRRLGSLALVIFVLASGANSLRDYARLATADWYYYELDSDIYEMGLYMTERARTQEVFIYGDTRLMRYGTIRALTRESATASFDSRWAVVFPPGPVEYLFLASDASSRDFGRYLPPETESFNLMDSRGKETVVGYRVDGRAAQAYNRTSPGAPLFRANQPPREPAQSSDASVSGEIALRGYGVMSGEGPESAPVGQFQPGQPFRVVLAWEALRQPSLSYHISVKAFDSQGRAWAQIDSPTGRGGYPTARWRPGEWVYDTYELALDPGAPPGSYYLEVTVYDVNTMRIFPVVSADGQSLAQHYILGDIQVVGDR
ncbi:MAG: glycosyltransferase family 39 protein [Dehalococcoidia bacterium]|nr:glycosyltransferase family 39 protein [Dehalococcoidia bacterium]